MSRSLNEDLGLTPKPGLSESERKRFRNEVAKDIIRQLRISKENRETFVELLSDWQLPRTKSLKRFVLSLAIVLVGAGVINADLTSLSIFGLEPRSDAACQLAAFLGMTLVIGWLAYELSLYVDHKRRSARIGIVEGRIPNAKA